MASLAATLANNFRTEWNEKYNANEQKKPIGGAFNAALEDTNSPYTFVTPELKQKAMMSAGRSVQIPVINYDSTVTIATSRPLSISDDENVSALQSLTFVIASGGFTMIPARHQNNEISYQADFNAKMRKLMFAMLNSLDGAVLTHLSTNKNQVSPDLLGKYTWDSNTLVVPKSYKDVCYSDLEILLMSKDMNPEMAPLNVIGNPFVASAVKYLGQQGGGNYQNLAYQFDGKDFYFTNNLSNGTGHDGTFYFMPKGSLGIVTRNEPDAILGSKTGKGHVWDIVDLPIINMKADSFYYEDAVDASSVDTTTTHLTRAYKQYFSFAVEYAILSNYNSDLASVANPLVKAAISNT